jgi:hypothetical protein
LASHQSQYENRSKVNAHEGSCLLSLQANRRALLEEDEANSCKELQIISEKLRQEDSRLMMLMLDTQLREMRNKMANVAFDGEAYVKNLPGVLPSLGLWDPLGFSKKTGVTEEKLNFYREAELKHGRIGTLAAFGILVSEQMNGVPAILAFQNSQLLLGTTLILATIALPDIKAVPLLSPTDKVKQTTELNGTRVGMLAAAHMIGKEIATTTCLTCSLAAATPEAAVVSQGAAVLSTALAEAA